MKSVHITEACPTNRTLERSLKFPFTRILLRIFRTRCKDTVTECSYYFGLQSIADLIKKRKLSFVLKFVSSPNSIRQVFVSVALCETKLYSGLSEFTLAHVCLYFVLVVSYC